MSQQPSVTKDTLTFVVKRAVKRHLMEGKEHFEKGDVLQAIEAYRAALHADPACALVYFNLGFAYHEERNYTEAIEAYGQAIELMPECALFREHLARLHFEINRYGEAIEIFERAVEAGEVQPISYGLLGRSYYEMKQYERAIHNLEQMLLHEDQPSLVAIARYHLILSLLKKNRLAAARKTSAELLAMDRVDNQLLLDLGERFLLARCVSTARRMFERVIFNNEEDRQARKRYEEILALDRKVADIVPKLSGNDEEELLRMLNVLLDVGSDEAAQAVAPLVDNPSALIREVAVEYHQRFGYQLHSDISVLLGDEVGFVRERAAAYVVSQAMKQGAELLTPLLEDEYAPARRQVALFFERHGNLNHMQLLQQAAAAEKDEETQAGLKRALEAIKLRYEEKVQAMARRQGTRGKQTPVHAWKRWLTAGAVSISLCYVIFKLIEWAQPEL